MNTNLKMIIRGILKNKNYIYFGVGGLVIAYSFSLLLITYLHVELSFDTQIPEYKQIYRVSTQVNYEGAKIKQTAKSQMPLGDALINEIPGIDLYTRILDEECLFRKGDIKYNHQKVYWVDEKFPEIFSLTMLEGNANDALAKPLSMIISETASKRFFGDESPVGKSLVLNEGIIIDIRGVFKNPTTQSHFNYDYLLSFNTITANGWNEHQNNWDTDAFYTYVKLAKNANIETVRQSLTEFSNRTYTNHHKKNQQVVLNLQPIKSIHLHSHLDDELSQNNKYSFILILALLGLVTLLVSWMYFSAMVCSRYSSNQVSLFINNILGASKYSLIKSIAVEILLLNFIAIIISFSLFSFVGDSIFNTLELPTGLYHQKINFSLQMLVALLISGVLVCSLMPVSVLAQRMKDAVKKDKSAILKTSNNHQTSFVVFQYSFSIFLIIFLIVAFQQIRFLKDSNPGFNKDQVLVVHSPRTLIFNPIRIVKGKQFIDLLKLNEFAKEVSYASDIPGKAVQTDDKGLWISPSENPDIKIAVDRLNIDDHYSNTLDLKIIAGRNFESQKEFNDTKLIVNECAVSELNFNDSESAIGSQIKDQNGNSFTIVGVVSDYHQEGLQEEIKPMVFQFGYDYLFGYCTVKLANVSESTIASIKHLWESIYPDDPFDYFFLDEQFNNQYRNEALFFKLCFIFGIVSMLIACYGLFSISLETILKKQKEIGIRKVNGATIAKIIAMLNLTYVRLTIISFLIATPFAYIFIHKWLQNFAYKIDLSWWIFAISGLLAMGIALLTVSWQSWRAATRNPVEALRYE
ncbi:ABC transporter permease [Sunxiuqinia sp. A32]|uniref:ABC transporter permease n=1 Tax=Sunxiuqinia sp. A32 TaxID=3461496 RepID=UPI004045A135